MSLWDVFAAEDSSEDVRVGVDRWGGMVFNTHMEATPVHQSPTAILVDIYTDGLGTYQARCQACAHRGTWRRIETTAVRDAKTHGASHA